MEWYYNSPDDLPVATLEQPGITQLNSNVDDVRIDQAATPYSVNQVWVTASNTQQLLALTTVDLAWTSNAAVYGSNAGAFGSNLSPGVEWSSNALPAISSTALAASNTAYWTSNALPAISSTALATSNSWFASSNPLFSNATFGSNAGAFGSNLSPQVNWTSNVVVAASNQAFSIGGGGQAQTPDLSFQQLRVTPSNAVTSGTAGIRLGGYLLSNQVIATAGNGDAKVALAVATARRAIESEARPHAVYVHNRLRAFSASAQLVDMSRVIDVGGWSITANAASFRVPRTGTYQLSPYFLTSGAITLRVNGGSAFTLVSGQTSLVVWKANDLLELLATSPTMATVYFELHVAMI
jgi:hypothetical protein